jgi:diguanylate cyclase (GGDEF)-like protein
MGNASVLVVDDDAFYRELSGEILRGAGYDVFAASSGVEAIGIIETGPVDIVITDLVMPGLGGLEVIRKVKQVNALTDVIVVTGHGTMETAIEALKAGASDYIQKPINEGELLHAVAGCVEKKRLLEENQEMRQSLRLFEVTRGIASTLDEDRLCHISLDAFLQVVPMDAGVLVSCADDMSKVEVRSLRRLDLSAGERLAALFKENYREALLAAGKDPGAAAVSMSALNAGEDPALKGYSTLLCAPLMHGARAGGFLIALRGRGAVAYAERDLRNAAFIAEHAAQAFENARRYSEARGMAFIDSLTNLYNAKYLEMALDNEIKRADRLLMPLTVLFLDLDRFKLINDRHDHLVGSRVLVEMAGVLLKCVREVDTVARYGGDEYVVILVGADTDVAMKVAERIRDTVEKERFLAEDGLDIRTTVSIGVASYPLHTRQWRELLKAADKAMYMAKALSRNVVCLAPPPDDSPAVAG